MELRDKRYNDIRLTFVEEGHKYFDSMGNTYTSTTTLLHRYVKPFDKDYWLKKKAKELDRKDKSHIYDYFTDSVETNAGRIGRAEWHYPDITDKRLTTDELFTICFLHDNLIIKVNTIAYYILEYK